MTEDEAREKWCPHTSVIGRASAGGNRLNKNDAGWPVGCECVASKCMAWRWADPEREFVKVYTDKHGLYPEGYIRASSQGCAMFKGESWNYQVTDTDERGKFDKLHRAKLGGRQIGYCGLAGDPS